MSTLVPISCINVLFIPTLKIYFDANEYGVELPSTKGKEYWANVSFVQLKEKDEIELKEKHGKGWQEYDRKLISVDIPHWDSYEKLKRDTNINYKDLLGTYALFSCPLATEFFTTKKTFTPIYKKMEKLHDGKEAFLYKHKFIGSWQVI